MFSRFFIVLVACLAITACGSSDDQPVPTATAPPATATDEPAAMDDAVVSVDVAELGFRPSPFGGVAVEGIVTNDGDAVASEVTVQVSAYDRDGAMIATSGTAYVPPLLNPGTAVPFQSVILNVDPENIAEVKAQVTAKPLDDGGLLAEYYSVDIETVSVQVAGDLVTGEVRNAAGRDISLDGVLISTHDSSGALLGVIYTSADTRVLAPGATSTFSAQLRLAGDATPAEVRAISYGRTP